MLCPGCTCEEAIEEGTDPVSTLEEVCDHCIEICECYDDDISDDYLDNLAEDDDE